MTFRMTELQKKLLDKMVDYTQLKPAEFLRQSLMAHALTTMGAVSFKHFMNENSEARKRLMAEMEAESEAFNQRIDARDAQLTKRLQDTAPPQYLNPTDSTGGVTDDIMPRIYPTEETPQEAIERIQSDKPFYESETEE